MNVSIRESTGRQLVDRTAIKAGQGVTGLALAAAFVADSWQAAAVVGLINLIAYIEPRLNLTRTVYRGVLLPLGMHENVVEDDPAPHRFAQGFSGVTTLVGAGAVATGWVWAWALVLAVTVFAVINISFGFCLGCATHGLLKRLGATR